MSKTQKPNYNGAEIGSKSRKEHIENDHASVKKKNDAKNDAPGTPGDANNSPSQGMEGGGAGDIISIIYTLRYHFSIIYKQKIDTYFHSMYSMKSLQHCSKLRLILRLKDKPNPETVALMFEIRTDTKCSRNDVLKEYRSKTSTVSL